MLENQPEREDRKLTKVNRDFNKFPQGAYFFTEIGRRINAIQEQYPDKQILRLHIGNTTQPLPRSVIEAMHKKVDDLSRVETYTGYGDELGDGSLRRAIGDMYLNNYGIDLFDSIFISDGAKPDTANIGSLFATDSIVAVEDPSYPVYPESNVLAGRTGKFDESTGRYPGIVYLPCTKQNGFFPELPDHKIDILYLCRPNNPMGFSMTREQFQPLVDRANREKFVIILDLAYVDFITSPSAITSAYEVPGAENCVIEIRSLSKIGFAGVRLGWTVVPKGLTIEDTIPGELHRNWSRRQTAMFNGASNVSQAGAIAALTRRGQIESKVVIDYYLHNAKMLREGLASAGLNIIGGVDAPYVYFETPNEMGSWSFFDKLLMETGVAGAPGVGFGPAGEGYFRLSALRSAEETELAIENIQNNLKL